MIQWKKIAGMFFIGLSILITVMCGMQLFLLVKKVCIAGFNAEAYAYDVSYITGYFTALLVQVLFGVFLFRTGRRWVKVNKAENNSQEEIQDEE
jgi:hypothetical protein